MDTKTAINVTEAAWERIKKILPASTDPKQKTGLRIKVVSGGCSGLQYNFSFDIEKAGDKKVEKDGCTVFVDQKSLLFIKGMTLDYFESLGESKFIIENPNAKNSCGCGNSFNT